MFFQQHVISVYTGWSRTGFPEYRFWSSRKKILVSTISELIINQPSFISCVSEISVYVLMVRNIFKKSYFASLWTWLQSSTNCVLPQRCLQLCPGHACNGRNRQPGNPARKATHRPPGAVLCIIIYIYIIFKYKHASYTYTYTLYIYEYIIYIYILILIYKMCIYIHIYIYIYVIYIYTRIFIFCMSRNYLLCIIYIHLLLSYIIHSGILFWFQAACYFPDPIPAASLELSVNIQWFGW